MVQIVIKPEIPIKPSAMVRLSNMACKNPFKYIEIIWDGSVLACCYSWLPAGVGNVLTDSVEEIINNEKRLSIQNHMRQGDFSDCTNRCPQLASILAGESNYWGLTEIDQFDSFLEKSRTQVYFSYDRSCNLQCPSCRDELIVWDVEDAQDAEGQRLKQVHEKVKTLVEYLVGQGEQITLVITGSGDAFASPLYWNYLLELAQDPLMYSNISIHLMTNGQLMTLENLKKIKNLWPIISFVEVSIDAATEETYKIVRKNGSFNRIKKNLNEFDMLVEQGNFSNLSQWQTNFVVQKSNFKELKEYVKWQMAFKSKPTIATSLIAQWQHIDDARFKGMAIYQDHHPDKQELIDILQDPIFRNDQIRLGNMSNLLDLTFR